VSALVVAGYPYELAGICYYVLFLLMNRKANAGRYSLRSRLLVICAAVVMVGCVPFHYAAVPLAVTVMLVLAILALLSTFADSLWARRR
jgi:uncharacterized membrane protein